MSGEINNQDIESKAALLHELFVGSLSETLSRAEAAERCDELWLGVGRFAVRQSEIEGTFCQGSVVLVTGSRSSISAFEVLVETDNGPYELRLSLLENGQPDFQITAPKL